MHRLFLIYLGLMVTILLVPQGKASACIGPSYGFGSFLANIESYNIIVGGRISSVSREGTNAILEIDHILEGDLESSAILLMRNSIEDVKSYSLGRGTVRPCEFMPPPLPQQVPFVASLHRFDSGYYDGAIIPADDNGSFLLEDNPEDQISRTYNEAIDFLAERLQVVPRTPVSETAPRPVLINISTERSAYVVPVDRLEVIETAKVLRCSAPIGFDIENCHDRLYASNGVDNVSFFSGDNTPETATSFSFPFSYAVNGDAGAFSANSDLLMVWRNQELRVYATSRQVTLTDWPYDGLSLISTRPFTDIEPLIPGSGAWHPNGRTFAFSTETGIWFWDPLTPESRPTLFMTADDEPLLVRHFSPGGNYLGIESNTHRYYLDIHTKDEYPDGEFSPDDRWLATYDTQAQDLTALQIYRVLPNLEPIFMYQKPDPEVWDQFTPMIFTYDISQFEWLGTNDLLFAACGSADQAYIGPTDIEGDWCGIRRMTFGLSGTWIDGVQFDYDPITGSLVTLLEGNRINLNGVEMDLSSIISEVIVSVQIEPLIDLQHQRFH